MAYQQNQFINSNNSYSGNIEIDAVMEAATGGQIAFLLYGGAGATGTCNGYVILYDSRASQQAVQIKKCTNGVLSDVGVYPKPVNAGALTGAHHVTIKYFVANNKFACYLDGVLWAKATDSTYTVNGPIGYGAVLASPGYLSKLSIKGHSAIHADNQDASGKAVIDFNSSHANQGALSKKNSVDLTTGDVINKSLANLDATAANTLSTASSNASTALANAATAQSTADAAKAYTDDLASDTKMTSSEKPRLKQEWDLIVEEATATTGTIPAQAIAFGVSTTAFDSAYSTLSTYLLTTLNVFGNMTTSTTIVRSTWATNWKTYYSERTKLLKAIADKAKQVADAAQAYINDMNDDGKITPAEKKRCKREWNAIQAEGNASTGTLIQNASAVGVASADITAFSTKYDALNTYLNTTLTLFSNMTAATSVTRTAWDTAWNDYFAAKMALEKAIATKASTTATWSGTSSKPSNVASLTGSENIQNLQITVDANGVLQGTGTSNVTVSNDKIAASHLQGTGKPFADGTINASRRPVIDLSDSHGNKHLDNIGDGTTYARPKATALSSGIPKKEILHQFSGAVMDADGTRITVNNLVG
jgi:hypothetical protein